jgi:hypothetical protein
VKTKKLTLVVISSLIALNLNFIGASQAQAAPCSRFDFIMFSGNDIDGDGQVEETGIQGYWGMANFLGDNENIIPLTQMWAKKTKSKKLKPKIIRFERLLKQYLPKPYKLSSYPSMVKAYEDLEYIIVNDLC